MYIVLMFHKLVAITYVQGLVHIGRWYRKCSRWLNI